MKNLFVGCFILLGFQYVRAEIKPEPVKAPSQLASSGQAQPQGQPSGPSPQVPPPRSCLADMQKFCASLPPGPQAGRTCLMGHLNEVQPDCRKHLEAGPQRMGRGAGRGQAMGVGRPPGMGMGMGMGRANMGGPGGMGGGAQPPPATVAPSPSAEVPQTSPAP